MNRNSLFGLLGITLLTFLGAFILGRWTRPAPPLSPAVPSAVVGNAFETESSNPVETESQRLLAAMQTEAYEEELEEESSLSGSNPSKKLSAKVTKKATKATQLAPAKRAMSATQDSSIDTGQAPAYTASDTASTSVSIAPRTVVAKDIAAIEERQNYGAQLPKDLLQKGVEAKVNVVGELADVIIMSSPSFDARSKDTVIKQVCIDLKSLGFKRVHITDGGDYTMHFGL